MSIRISRRRMVGVAATLLMGTVPNHATAQRKRESDRPRIVLSARRSAARRWRTSPHGTSRRRTATCDRRPPRDPASLAAPAPPRGRGISADVLKCSSSLTHLAPARLPLPPRVARLTRTLVARSPAPLRLVVPGRPRTTRSHGVPPRCVVPAAG